MVILCANLLGSSILFYSTLFLKFFLLSFCFNGYNEKIHLH
uniref:Uncharacterized protein n=1 Tax=Anguilla anguilla TaxID=7936 RepID=A0A0E9UDK6_ANGAN